MVKVYTNRQLLIRVLLILVIELIAVVITYQLHNNALKTAFFLALFTVMLFSKDVSFWIALFYIVGQGAFGFLDALDSTIIYLTPKAGLRILQAFAYFLCLYVIIKKDVRLNRMVFRLFLPYTGFVVFTFIVSVNFGMDIVSLFKFLMQLSSVFFLITIPSILSNQSNYIKFNQIVFVFSILLLAHNIFEITSGGYITGTLAPQGTYRYSMNDYTDREIVRQTGGIFIALYSLVVSTSFLLNKKFEYFSKHFLIITAISSVIFIVNSATRGWIIAASFVIIIAIFSFGIKKAGHVILFIVVFSSVIYILPDRVKNNLQLALYRFETVAMLAQGDVTAGGTLKRLDERAPRVMIHFSDSRFWGFGYSEITAKFGDGHVGNHNLLLFSGIVGFVYVYMLLFALLVWIYKKSNNYKPNIIIAGIFAMIIIHSTSRQIIGYPIIVDGGLYLSLLLVVPFNNTIFVYEENINNYN